MTVEGGAIVTPYASGGTYKPMGYSPMIQEAESQPQPEPQQKPYTIKDVNFLYTIEPNTVKLKTGQISFQTYAEQQWKAGLHYVSSKTASFLPEGKVKTFLTTPIQVGGKTLSAPAITDIGKTLFFYPAMMTTTETYGELIRTGQIVPESRTSFVAEIEKFGAKDASRINVVSKTYMGEARTTGVSSQIVRGVSGESSVGIGKGFVISKTEKDISLGRSFTVVSKTTEQGTAKLVKGNVELLEYGRGLSSRSFIKETVQIKEAQLPVGFGNYVYRQTTPLKVSVREQITTGVLKETPSESLFLYRGTNIPPTKVLTNKGFVNRIYSEMDISGFVRIKPDRTSNIIKTFESKTPITKLKTQAVTTQEIQSISTQAGTLSAQSKGLILKEFTQATEKMKPFKTMAITSSQLQTQRQYQIPLATQTETPRQQQRQYQTTVIKLETKQQERLFSTQVVNQIQREEQALKLKPELISVQKLEEPQMRKPIIPRGEIPFGRMPIPLLYYSQMGKKGKGKSKKKRGKESLAIAPSFTAQVLGIKRSVSAKQLRAEAGKFRTGAEIRGVLRIK